MIMVEILTKRRCEHVEFPRRGAEVMTVKVVELRREEEERRHGMEKLQDAKALMRQ